MYLASLRVDYEFREQRYLPTEDDPNPELRGFSLWKDGQDTDLRISLYHYVGGSIEAALWDWETGEVLGKCWVVVFA